MKEKEQAEMSVEEAERCIIHIQQYLLKCDDSPLAARDLRKAVSVMMDKAVDSIDLQQTRREGAESMARYLNKLDPWFGEEEDFKECMQKWQQLEEKESK